MYKLLLRRRLSQFEAQTEPIRGKGQIKNRAGGYGFKLDDWGRLDRFLILGHEGGSYYATRKELSLETVDCLDREKTLRAPCRPSWT
jgi:60 kDa SS-A/Ro ribonucleoprotein